MVHHMKKGRGTQFDPVIADIMLQMIAEDTQYTMKQPEETRKNILVLDDDMNPSVRIGRRGSAVC